MPVMTSLQLLDGVGRDGAMVVVAVGRSVSGTTVVTVGDAQVELDAQETLRLIIAAGESLRLSGSGLVERSAPRIG